MNEFPDALVQRLEPGRLHFRRQQPVQVLVWIVLVRYWSSGNGVLSMFSDIVSPGASDGVGGPLTAFDATTSRLVTGFGNPNTGLHFGFYHIRDGAAFFPGTFERKPPGNRHAADAKLVRRDEIRAKAQRTSSRAYFGLVAERIVAGEDERSLLGERAGAATAVSAGQLEFWSGTEAERVYRVDSDPEGSRLSLFPRQQDAHLVGMWRGVNFRNRRRRNSSGGSRLGLNRSFAGRPPCRRRHLDPSAAEVDLSELGEVELARIQRAKQLADRRRARVEANSGGQNLETDSGGWELMEQPSDKERPAQQHGNEDSHAYPHSHISRHSIHRTAMVIEIDLL
jgi:hypothetical protein